MADLKQPQDDIVSAAIPGASADLLADSVGVNFSFVPGKDGARLFAT